MTLTDLERRLLQELASRDVKIPAIWKTVDIYNALVDHGFAAPIINVGPLMCGFHITPEGVRALKEKA